MDDLFVANLFVVAFVVLFALTVYANVIALCDCVEQAERLPSPLLSLVALAATTMSAWSRLRAAAKATSPEAPRG